MADELQQEQQEQQQHVMHRVVEVSGLRASLVRRRIIRAPCASMPGCHIERV